MLEAASANFSGGGMAPGMKVIWIKKQGPYRYYSYVLAGFDPIRAEAIFDLTAEAIAEAFVTMMVYNYHEPQK